MNYILPLLRQLDEVYHAGNLDDYEQCWQEAALQIECLFPGFTLFGQAFYLLCNIFPPPTILLMVVFEMPGKKLANIFPKQRKGTWPNDY
jgi:hypothetical protein